MTQIMLTPEQTAQLADAGDVVVVLDASGKQVGQISRVGVVFSAERIAAAKERLGTEQGGVTTAQLLANLQRLSEAR
jgi:hypothetical protein